jgi:cell division protein ZapA
LAEKPKDVQVEIFGQSYGVRAVRGPGYVERLAALVDEEMREVSRAGGTVDSLRVAVLAALNLADQVLQARERSGREDGLEGRAARLVEELEAVLGE